MPVPVPYDAGRSAEPLQYQAGAESGIGEQSTPRVRCDERAGRAARLEIRADLPYVSINPAEISWPEHGRDHYGHRYLILGFLVTRMREGVIVGRHVLKEHPSRFRDTGRSGLTCACHTFMTRDLAFC